MTAGEFAVVILLGIPFWALCGVIGWRLGKVWAKGGRRES